MDLADEALVYYNPEVFAQKKMQIIEKEDITKNFGSKVWAIEDSKELISKISEFKSNVFGKPCVILLMSSGNFDNAKMW
jgi:UDP-N-acetylmuramate: L-alanyl-gamma-D-glutamyl-meso-diaminopimelate ligase